MQIAVNPVVPRDCTLLGACVVASMALHALLLTVLPGLRTNAEEPPKPLVVALKPVEIEPPKPLPLAPEPQLPKSKPKVESPIPPKPAESRRVDPPAPTSPAPTTPAKTVLTAPPDAPVTPQTPVVPAPPAAEPKPVAPPPPVQAAPPAPPPVTPPRSDAAYLNNPRPNYPLAARRRGDHGTVLVRVLVSADGLAASVGLEKSSGYPALDEAALTAVKSWRFVPAKQGAQAVEAPHLVPVVFRLD